MIRYTPNSYSIAYIRDICTWKQKDKWLFVIYIFSYFMKLTSHSVLPALRHKFSELLLLSWAQEKKSDTYFVILTSSSVGPRWSRFGIYKGTNLLVRFSFLFLLLTESPTILLSGMSLFWSPWQFAVCSWVLPGLTFFFLIGAVCPVILWLMTRRYPNTILNYLKSVFFHIKFSHCWHSAL